MNIKAVIFDMDGTLVNGITDITLAVNHALSKMSLPCLTEVEAAARLGNGIDRLMKDSLPIHLQENKKIIAHCLEDMANYYGQHWKQNTVLYPHIPKLLDTLMINNIPMAIISNKPQDFLSEMVNYLMSKWEFDAVIGSRNKYPLKPNPQSTIDIAKKWNIDLEQIAFVGDGDADVKTAQAAGTQMISVTWGFRTKEELQALGSTLFIDSPLELLNYIN